MIGSAWLEVVDRVLRPSRPCLARCLGARASHLGRRRAPADVQRRALASCERRIDDARARVFAAGDGVVGRHMTELEREWRKLSSPDPEAGLMDLWVKLAPSSWLDRKRYRGAGAGSMLDAVVALASDPGGVEAAERAAVAVVTALRPHGVSLASRLVWRPLAADRECVGPLLGPPLEVARAACPRKIEARVMARAAAVAGEVERAVLARHPGRPGLARDLAATARLDVVWSAAASLAPAAGPAMSLRELYGSGYALAAADGSSLVLAFPPVSLPLAG